MLTTSIWFQKVKATADAIWCISCLIAVPGVVVASIYTMSPDHYKHQSVWRLPSSSVDRALTEADSAPGLGKSFYQLGLFNREGKLIHEYPKQGVEPNRDPQRGSIVIEIPEDVPSGDYYLRVFRGEGKNVRDVPLKVGGDQ